MLRRLSLLIVALLIPFLVVRDAPADIGRSGGIVILPCAISIANCGQQLRAQYEFPVGGDIVFALPSNLGPNVMTLIEVDGSTMPAVGRIENGMLILRGAELRSLRAIHIPSFRMTLVDAQQRALLIEFVLKLDVDSVRVW
ncbi:MAG: hypothetical protein HZB39_17850 [Planctomycetes bacterium]|nr:hypothetical protein [Planctomycetota bacterium]